MKRILFFAVFFAFACVDLWAQVPGLGFKNGATSPEPVSMITLVANGAGYNRKDIAVGGYLATVGANVFLFVSAEHAEAKDLPSAIRIEAGAAGRAEIEVHAGAWVRLIGNYHRATPSAREPWAGTLENAGNAD